MKFTFIKDIGKYFTVGKAVVSAMNGKKLNTGTIMIIAVFVLQQMGIGESEAKEIFNNIFLAIGSVLTVWGYIHRIIKAKQGAK